MHVAALEYVFKCSSSGVRCYWGAVSMFTSAPHSALIAVVVSVAAGPVLSPVLALLLSQWGEECGELSLHWTTHHCHWADNCSYACIVSVSQFYIRDVVNSCRITHDTRPLDYPTLVMLMWTPAPSPVHYCLFIKSSTHPNTVHVDTGITNYWFSEY